MQRDEFSSMADATLRTSLANCLFILNSPGYLPEHTASRL